VRRLDAIAARLEQATPGPWYPHVDRIVCSGDDPNVPDSYYVWAATVVAADDEH
jgi:hypothetical protein